MCLTSVKISAIINKLICGDAGIGRQASLRCLCQYWRVGSSPISRTSVKDIRFFECPLFLYLNKSANYYHQKQSRWNRTKSLILWKRNLFRSVKSLILRKRNLFRRLTKASPRCPSQYWRVGSSPISRTGVKDIRFFECPLFLYPAKKRKLQYIYIQNLFIFKQQFIFTYFRSKSTVIILSVPIIGLITQYIDKLLSNGFCKYVYEYNNSNRNNSFLLAIITFKCYNTH